MKKVLLTGSSGFIGSHFVEDYATKFSIRKFSFIDQDINSLDLDKIEVIVHLAALVHQMSGAEEEKYLHVNSTNTLELAHKAKLSGVKHFVFMSSVKVFGEENIAAYSEQSVPKPIDMYGESKYIAEKELLKLEDKTFKISIIRTPVVYGERVKANILKLIELVDNYSYLPFAQINNRRSMIYVKNLGHYISEIIVQEESGLFLPSDDEVLSTNSLVSYIAEALGKKIYLFNPLFLSIGLRYIKPALYSRLYLNLEVDSRLSNQKLDIQNPYTTKKAIINMVAWYKSSSSR